jgi:hypothetical protein
MHPVINKVSLAVLLFINVVAGIWVIKSVPFHLAHAVDGPTLTIPTEIPAMPGQLVTVPVHFAANGTDISSIVFSVDFDETKLSFNSLDGDGNGIPDAIHFNVSAAFAAMATYNSADSDGELDFVIFDPIPPAAALSDGVLVSIEFTTGSVLGVAPVNFSQEPPPSFGNTAGGSVSGTVFNGSVLISSPTYTPTPPPPTIVSIINLPIVMNNYPPTYSISGRVINSNEVGIGNVVISTNLGQTAVTNNDGYYLFTNLLGGIYSLSPSKTGYTFSPISRPVSLPPDAVEQNFLATAPTSTPTPPRISSPPPGPTNTPPPPSCTNHIVNSSFEDFSGWIIGQNEYPASYTTVAAHSGSRSMRIGILNPADNVYSYSSTWQWVTIPADAASATLKFWLYTASSATTSGAALKPEIVPINSEDGTLSGDAQFVLVFDQYGQQNTLLFQTRNNQAWTYHGFNLGAYKGQTVKLYFGVYNDGWDGITGMYVDDVFVESCPAN